MEHLLTFQADKTRKIIGQHPAHGVKDDTTSSSRNSTYRGSKNWHKDQVFEKFAEASLSGESATGIKIWESSTPMVVPECEVLESGTNQSEFWHTKQTVTINTGHTAGSDSTDPRRLWLITFIPCASCDLRQVDRMSHHSGSEESRGQIPSDFWVILSGFKVGKTETFNSSISIGDVRLQFKDRWYISPVSKIVA
ncbi:hypothetical protein GEV33_009002 [Tenebrio molitor]|uniref:Uncharacterized protein n=1 Tax=Tenebrio molitor TaxID=7067 RepID=A0A8J6LBV4_TENMO|nr:hypothetical protein GEV33_009002 [Tenebrio molitor]